MKQPIIALHGLPRVGKDSLADKICEEIAGAAKFAFADLLYEDLADVFGVTEEQLQSHAWKTEPQDSLAMWHSSDADYRQWLCNAGVGLMDKQTSRFHLQRYGTDYRQHSEGVSYWARRLSAELDDFDAEHDELMVISDLRRYGGSFHELDMLRGWSARHNRTLLVVYVSRPGAEETGHISDTLLPQTDIDVVLRNTGSIHDLYAELATHLPPATEVHPV